MSDDGGVPSDPVEELQILRETREGVFAEITRVRDLLLSYSKSKINLGRAKYEYAKKLRAEFKEIQNEILLKNRLVDSKNRVERDHTQKAFDGVFEVIEVHFSEMLDSVPPPVVVGTNVAPQQSPQPSNLRIPDLKVPVFSNHIKDFPNFIQLFDCVYMQNKSLTNVERFYYLLSLLSQESLAIVQQYPLTDKGFEDAYDALKARYESPRTLASIYVKELLNFEPLKKASALSLTKYLEVHFNQVTALKSLSDIKDLGDFLLMQICAKNLDSLTRRLFENQVTSTIPTYNELMTFVSRQCKTQSLLETEKDSPSFNKPSTSVKQYHPVQLHTQKNVGGKSQKGNFTKTSVHPKLKCGFCDATDHKIYRCPSYEKLSFSDRMDWVQSKNRCYGCLGLYHDVSRCNSVKACVICQSRLHHSTLHDPNLDKKSGEDNPQASSLSCVMDKQVLLSTLVVNYVDSAGFVHPLRALLDSGSMVSLVTTDCASRLGLKITKSNTLSLKGISSAVANTEGSVNMSLCSRFDPTLSVKVNAGVLNNITSNLPTTRVPKEVVAKFSHLPLGDPNFGNPAKIDILLAVDTMMEILSTKLENFQVDVDEPKVLNTGFGYIVCGNVPGSPENRVLFLTCEDPMKILENRIEQFWECETVPSPKTPILTPEEEFVVSHFEKTYTRDLMTGKFSVSLPFKPKSEPLKFNRTRALAAYHSAEKRLAKDPKALLAYRASLAESADLRQIKRADTPSPYLVTHHGVYKSPKAPIRVVFNASFPSGNPTVSLNSILLPGPKLQADITQVMTSFRLFVHGIVCDISQMFKNINLNPDSDDLIHFVARVGNQPLLEWVITHLCFGLTCSPFIALKAVDVLIEEHRNDFPVACDTLAHNRYCDDICSGADTIPDLIKLRDELIHILNKGGFPLKKFASSNQAALAGLDPDLCLQNPVKVFEDNFSPSDEMKVLGMHWVPSTDTFNFQLEPFSGEITKKTCMSYMMKVYDPCGWINPYVFSMKLFMQKLWSIPCGWDDKLDDSLQNEWLQLVKDVSLLSEYDIKRCIRHPSAEHYVCAFSDASFAGWGSCLYLVNKLPSGETSAALIMAKSKLAPLKCKWTIPKLELNGILMGAKLIHWFKTSNFPVKISRYCLFSDSTIALSWVAGGIPVNKLLLFCANRVSQIHELVPYCTYHFVPTEINEADRLSRGNLIPTLISSPSWFSGPRCLYENFPPESKFSLSQKIEELPEIKIQKCFNTVPSSWDTSWFEKFSDWPKLVTIVASLLRFLHNIKNVSCKNVGPISAKERESAILHIVLCQQASTFSEALNCLQKNKQVPRNLLSFTPFLLDGIIRAGGRISNAPVSFSEKHPVMLSAKCHIATLLCRHYHQLSGHAGLTLSLSLLRQKYLIIHVRSLMKSIIHNCVHCARWNPKKLQPIMGDLPESRVTPNRTFASCGMDYAGYFNVKTGPRRNSPITKGYLLVIVCFFTKCVHLEFVSELSCKAFFAAFDRFVSRRSLPTLITTDQGRTFIGASNQLKELQKFMVENKDKIINYCAHRQVEWRFNNVYSPEISGLSEAAVKSAKLLLKRIIGDQIFDFESYSTIFARIEALLNSRPLFPITVDSDDVYLSPSHFLVSGPLVAAPEPLVEERSLSIRCRWTRLRDIVQCFWKQWLQQVINKESQRSKWRKATPSITVGQLVLVPDAKCSPSAWPLGIVEAVLTGSQNAVRTVQIRLATKDVIIRSVNKLVIVPVVGDATV